MYPAAFKKCQVYVYLFFLPVIAWPQSGKELSVHYEELTAVQFVAAVHQAGETCVIPLGIIEKHGPHLPLGTDLLGAREVARAAAAREYTIVFPPYFVGQIYEAKPQPGTMAYKPELVWEFLQQTCTELSRNGFKKIILFNGHGGNNNFLQYFCQVQLAERKNYALYLFNPGEDAEFAKKVNSMRKTMVDGHAGEMETSSMLATHPHLVQQEVAGTQSGADQDRLTNLPDTYVGIWWYAKFPNHYAGDGRAGDKKLGQLLFEHDVAQLAAMIKAVKADTMVLKLQDQFFNESENPLQHEK
jgi:creatinine amidohydrolase